ncbi:MAG TPA: alkaline phosphatase family protein [Pyrinomonadaceae bacterium]|jgi:predicted AlkP superfamily pyrophosphatase or phosphodiesterase|nr:alkaline phosphatase family protein [Pyrinomonadaceae bacterium]
MKPSDFKRRRTGARLPILLALVFALLASAAPAARPQARAPQPQGARPRLVLLIVVDQFRYDYLERFGDLFAAGGLRRLMREGASWTEANYDHVPTETAPGHATLMTGAWPAETGIISNEWYDRESNRRIANSSDPGARLLGGGPSENASSPRNLLVSTLGDELKLATAGRAKVVGVSIKDRGAILPAGRMADAAYWYSSQTGRFVSSTYYFDRLPDWVTAFGAAHPAGEFYGKTWDRLLDKKEYDLRAGPDDAPWERGNGKQPTTLPQKITGGETAPGPAFYEALNYSPFSNDLLVSFAEEAIRNERLGEDSDTDVLTVSFSANDLVGHRYGPYSHELMDMTVRVDRHIERLLSFVDSRVGLRNTLVAFTADHGVAPFTEHARQLRLPGGYVGTTDLNNAVRNRLKARFGKGGDKDNTADYVLAYGNSMFYFNRAALDRDGVRQEDVERVAGEAAMTVPGVSRFFTRTQLVSGAVSPADAVARRVLHGFNPRRSGDVVIIQEPYKYLTDSTYIAIHGTPYSYDTHVPVIVMGAGVAPGRYAEAASPADIAPTLARLLRVQPPSNAMGRVLAEAMIKQ